MRTSVPRVVLVERPTEYAELLARHGTREQARFFLETRGRSIAELDERHRRFAEARQTVLAAIPARWRRAQVSRADLDRFLFEPADVVAVLGQDGLVANTAKYLDGQPVVGLDPDPELHEGELVRHHPSDAGELLDEVVAGRPRFEDRTMVEARLGDGQSLLAVNEVFVGHESHQSARYLLRAGASEERQSSSGIVVVTGTGATGWGRSIHAERRSAIELPAPTQPSLAFFVREAWPSVASGTTLTEGVLETSEELTAVSEMNERGTIFGDGIESDRLRFAWGEQVSIRLATRSLRLVLG